MLLFFTIIDPVGLAPVVIGLTAHLNDVHRRKIITALIAAWLVMRSSLWIISHIGRTGILVLSRILVILLAALALQFILNGIITFIQVSGLGK